MTCEVSAIVVNYNAGDDLRAALRSIADEMAGRAWEAMVVDNASSDGSADVANEFAPRVRLIANRHNVGFGRAVNQALASVTAPRVLIMNPDCRLEPGAMAALAHVLDWDPACAIVGPRILDPDGAVQGSARGDPDMLTGLFGRASALRRLLPRLPVSKRNVVEIDGAFPGARVSGTGPGTTGPGAASGIVVDWVSGACMLARRCALEAIGGFDERYFLYWEDADLCRRLRNRGYRIRYVPAATAVHRIGQSSRTAPARAIRAFHESAYLYYTTHVAPGRFNPKRWIARAVLSARCALVLRRTPFEGRG
jgi:N-acetylglucosaminyl-diphospho-decaprenol L-rhamnosyltransferase